MSILQDLDPKYARIQRQSSIGGWKLLAWVVSLLLVLTWVTWLIFTLRIGDGFSEPNSLKNAVSEQVISDAPPPKASTPLSPEPHQISAPLKADALPASNTTSGSAIIQETQASKSSLSNPVPPEPISQAMTELPIDHLGDKKTPRKQIEPAEKKSASHTAERQANNSHTNKVTTAPSPFVPTKRAAERDIDIITAIVR